MSEGLVPLVYYKTDQGQTVTSYIRFEGDEVPSKYTVRAKSWGTPKMLTLLSACGLHGQEFILLNGRKDLSVIKRGEIENFATMSSTGWIEMKATPQPLPENMALFQEQMVKWFGKPKLMKEWMERTCQYEGCSRDLGKKHGNAKYCGQHRKMVEREQNRLRQQKKRSQATELEEGEKLPWEE